MLNSRFLRFLSVIVMACFVVSCAPNPYSHVTTLLGSKGPAAKERAARKLAGMKGDVYVDALTKALYDPNQRVIIAAADALAKTGDPKAVPHLEKLLGDSRGDVSRAAASALSRIKDIQAAEALVRAEEARYRAMGIDMLGRLQMPDAVPALAFALGDKEVLNRLQAVQVLSKIGTEEAAQALKEAANDPDPSVRAQAVSSLVDMKGKTAFVSLSASSENSLELAEKMAQLVLHFLEQEDLRSSIAAEANSLARYMTYYCTNYVQQDIYSERDKTLTQLYFKDLPEMIIEEMELISNALLGAELSDIAEQEDTDYVRPGRYTPRAFVSAVKQEAGGEENEFVTETVRYLERVISADSKSLVVVDGRQPSSREYAMMGLSYIDSAVAAQALLKSASGHYYDYFVVRGLVDLGFKAKQALVAALTSDDAFVRSQAMLALAFLPDPEVESLAERQLKVETDPIVRIHCQLALYQNGHEEMFEEMLKAVNADDTQTILRGLYALWYVAESLPERTLLGLLAHPDDRVRRRAADISAKKPVASPAVMESLTNLLKDRDGQVRSAASDALAAIDRQALPALSEAIDGPDRLAREGAARALVRMGGEKAVELIAGLLDDSSSALRSYAAESLGGLVSELGPSRLSDDVKSRLQKALDSENSAVVLRGCILSLGKLRDYDSATKMVRLMEKQPTLGKEAAVALAQMMDDESVKRLVMAKFRKLDSEYVGFSPAHDSEEYRQLFFISYPAAVDGNKAARKRLKDVLMQGDFRDRIVAAEFLGRLGDPDSLKDLLKAAEYESKGLAPFDLYLRRAAQRAAVEILLEQQRAEEQAAS